MRTCKSCKVYDRNKEHQKKDEIMLQRAIKHGLADACQTRSEKF